MTEPARVVRAALQRVLEREILSPSEMEAVMAAILSGEVPSALLAGFAIGLRVRGETADELAAAARVLRNRAAESSGLRLAQPLFDCCGTGGDGSGSFNISTTAAIVVASCGVRVAKHGSRAVSSRAGSSDVLSALGVKIDPSRETVARTLDALNIAFLFAPAYHAAMRHASEARSALGVRTFFNLLGPLASPVSASHQLVGVYDLTVAERMARALISLGVESAWVVHGHGGLDEISCEGSTEVVQVRDGQVALFRVAPSDFGLEPAPVSELAGGDAEENARLIRAVLRGERGARRNAVVLNSAAGLLITGVESDRISARQRAERAIDSGDANRLLDRWIEALR